MAEIEHDVKVIPIDNNLQEAVKKLEAEGWELFPGVQPIAVYHVARIKGKTMPAPAAAGFGLLGVDDTKVHVIRDGKLLDS